MGMTFRKARRFVRKHQRQFSDSHRRWQVLGHFYAAYGRFPNGWDLDGGRVLLRGKRAGTMWLWFHRWVEQHESTALERHYAEQRALQPILDAIRERRTA